MAALHMVHCFHLAGFPKGLINCVTGKGFEIGDFLTMHPIVNCIRYFLVALRSSIPRTLSRFVSSWLCILFSFPFTECHANYGDTNTHHFISNLEWIGL